MVEYSIFSAGYLIFAFVEYNKQTVEHNMEESPFLQNLWTSISLDKQSRVTEVRNPNNILFFGKCPEVGSEFIESFPCNERDRQHFRRIAEAIECAAGERRTVFLTYYSSEGEKEIPVSMFIEYRASEIRLNAIAIHADDMRREHEVSVETLQSAIVTDRTTIATTSSAATATSSAATATAIAATTANSLNSRMTIFEYLPIGLEIYDADGRMIEINSQELRSMGIVDKKHVLGLNLFENPNFPTHVRAQLMAGKDVQFISNYDFSKAIQAGYYPTSKSGNCLLNVSITIIRGSAGKVENYLLISQDITERIQIQQKYETLYNQNMTILNSLPVGVEIYTPDGKLAFLTETDCRIFGVNQQEVLALNLTIDDNPNLPPEVKEAAHKGLPVQARFVYRFDAVNEKEYYNHSQVLPVLHIECTGQPVIGSDGKIQNYVFIVQDVTEDVNREEELRHSNVELQRRKMLQDNILNNIPIPIHIKDIENNSRYVFCNEESTRMFGTQIGGSIYDVMDERQVARVEKTDKEVFSTGKPYFGVERIELRNGQSFDVLVRKSIIYNGNKRMLLNVRWDQSLQNDLQRRAKVLSLSMQAMNAYTWFYDPEKNRVSFGEGFERMGRNAQMSNTREKFAEFIHPDDRQLFIDTQVKELEKESSEWVVEYRIDLEGTGNYEWWETRGLIETTMFDDVPHKFMLGMSINIDSHKKTELELREAKLRAEESDKLKSAFLANMSHEIRTPLNSIVGFSDLLMNTEEQEDREEYMRIINNNTELLLKLIGDILDLSKIESGSIELKYEEFDLSDYFDDMSTSMRQRVTKPGLELKAYNPYGEYIVRLDRSRITQIMTNYVTNAIKYTPKGVIEMGYDSIDEGIRFYVKDTGIGIADDKKCKVFHRFEKLDEFAQGTGLGLSICKAIAESMGGSVGFESTYGEGSLFWAILPCR